MHDLEPGALRRLLVTGSRHWVDVGPVRLALERAVVRLGGDPGQVVVVHGQARGLDSIAEREALELGMRTEAHPAQWAEHGRRAGPMRNRRMVELGADVCLGFPIGGPQDSRGTYGCMSLALAAGIPSFVVAPDGAIRRLA